MKAKEKTLPNLNAAQLSRAPEALVESSFKEASEGKIGAMWQTLATWTVDDAMQEWLRTLGRLTAKNYTSGMRILIDRRLVNATSTLQTFSLLNHNGIIDAIKSLPDLSESSKQARAACYISFTHFLNRRTEGMIPKAMPNREGAGKTFYRVREKIATEAMNRVQWTEFLQALEGINKRDALIAKLALQGGKRLGEVLSLTTDMIDYAQREITFKQSKTKGYEKETVITYPRQIMDELHLYVGERTGLVFVTRTFRRIIHTQLSRTFAQAGINAQIPFKVTPHVLRTSTVTYLKREGFADSDIMKITGHASAEMVHAYDKSERAQNASKKISLV